MWSITIFVCFALSPFFAQYVLIASCGIQLDDDYVDIKE